MKKYILPQTKLGKISVWGIIYFLISWGLVAYLEPRFGSGNQLTHSTIDWILFLFALTGMLAAFMSVVGNLIAIVWREDRTLVGITAFIVTVPIAILLISFLISVIIL